MKIAEVINRLNELGPWECLEITYYRSSTQPHTLKIKKDGLFYNIGCGNKALIVSEHRKNGTWIGHDRNSKTLRDLLLGIGE